VNDCIITKVHLRTGSGQGSQWGQVNAVTQQPSVCFCQMLPSEHSSLRKLKFRQIATATSAEGKHTRATGSDGGTREAQRTMLVDRSVERVPGVDDGHQPADHHVVLLWFEADVRDNVGGLSA
jgi:hypothetical protein